MDTSIHFDLCGEKYHNKTELRKHVKNRSLESLYAVLQLNGTTIVSREASNQRDLMEELQRNVNMEPIFDYARTLLQMELSTAKLFGVALLLLGEMLVRIHGQEWNCSVFTLKRRHSAVLDNQSFAMHLCRQIVPNGIF